MTVISNPNHYSIGTENIVGISTRNRFHGLLGRISDKKAQQMGPDPQFNLSILELLNIYRGHEIIAGSAGAVALQEILRSGPRIENPIFIRGGLAQYRERTLLTIGSDVDNPLWLPVSNFVYAPGFGGWDQGRGQMPKNGADSPSLIRQYARKRSSTSPPIEFVSAYIQPDGTALFSVSAGSHRVSAAHARGDNMIAVAGSVAVVELTQNIVPPQITSSRTA